MAITPIGSNSFPPMEKLGPLATKTNTATTATTATTANKTQSSTSLTQNLETQQPNSSNINKEDVKHAVDSMNEVVSKLNNSLRFSLDDDTGQTVVKVVDTETKEVLKQIPSEEMLAISKAVDKLVGLLVQQKS